ncbi:MAG: BolA/IbaG family iron-sulfur metabolism protein [Chromatiales bacterium]|jgi:BolA protein
MTLQQTIETKLNEALAPEHLEVVNESHMHNVPPGSESHFKITIVAGAFEGKRLVARHQMINGLLADELAGPVHAMALHTLTPDEYFERAGKVPDSPPCQGGDKG